MKHPVFYRFVIYSIIGGLCLTIMLLLSLMQDSRFSSKDMGFAYAYGCNFGGPRPLPGEHILKCVANSEVFKDTLDDLDEQMKAISDK